MKASQPGPFAKPSLDPSLAELLRQALNGLLPVSPDLTAFLDRMETPR